MISHFILNLQYRIDIRLISEQPAPLQNTGSLKKSIRSCKEESRNVSPGIAGFFCICDSASWQGKAIAQTVEMVLIFLAITPISDYNNKVED